MEPGPPDSRMVPGAVAGRRRARWLVAAAAIVLLAMLSVHQQRNWVPDSDLTDGNPARYAMVVSLAHYDAQNDTSYFWYSCGHEACALPAALPGRPEPTAGHLIVETPDGRLGSTTPLPVPLQHPDCGGAGPCTVTTAVGPFDVAPYQGERWLLGLAIVACAACVGWALAGRRGVLVAGLATGALVASVSWLVIDRLTFLVVALPGALVAQLLLGSVAWLQPRQRGTALCLLAAVWGGMLQAFLFHSYFPGYPEA